MSSFSIGARPPDAGRWLSIVRRLAGGIIAAVGLIFLIIGILFMIGRSWPTATGTVGQCVMSTTYSGANHSRTQHDECTVTWTYQGRQHTTSIDFGARHAAGQPVTLRVHGNQAIEDTPGWVSAIMLGVGIVLLLAGLGLALLPRRGRRASTLRTALST